MVLADVIKRWQLLKGRKAVLSTGIDEHGMKVEYFTRNDSPEDCLLTKTLPQVQQAALKAGSDPKSFCDKGDDIFRVSPVIQIYQWANLMFLRP